MSILRAGWVALAVVAWFLQSATVVAARGPNVVMIISDDQAWGDFSFMGHKVIRTPNLDRLAAEGLTFTRGYVPSSLCRPSLATLATGLYPHQHKITSNDPPWPPGKKWGAANSDPGFRRQRQEMIDYIDKVPTLPRMLGKRGYLSLQTGKWWEGNFRRGGFTSGMTRGFPQPGGRHGDDGLKIGRNGMKPIFDFIDRAGDRPFFVWYAPFLPHSPHNPPPRLLEKYTSKTDSIHVARYWAMCEWFDETCGQLLDHLERKGLTKNTLVVFVTDNGWIQQPGSPRYAPKSKRSPYDGGIRTPIILRWPGHIQPRRDEEHLAISTDLVPTILAACGIDSTPAMQGIDLLDAEAVASRKAICGEIFSHNAVDIHRPASSLLFRWCIAGSWKLIVPQQAAEPGAAVELFDILKDPHETRDLAAQQPDRVRDLRAVVDAWWKPQ